MAKRQRLVFIVKDVGDVALVNAMEGWEAVKPKSVVDVKFSEHATSFDRDYLEKLLVPNPTVLVRGVDRAPHPPPKLTFSTWSVVIIVIIIDAVVRFVLGYCTGDHRYARVPGILANVVDGAFVGLYTYGLIKFVSMLSSL